MIAQPQLPSTYSPEEYLDLEVASDVRHEYIHGEIVPMTGGTPNHNQILLNLAGALNFVLRQRPYQVFAADQRLWIPAAEIYTYPDVMVVEGDLVYQAGRRDTLTNPTVILEVLSASTQSYDRGDKFAAYRTIDGFREYALINQYSAHVEHHVKTGAKQWLMQEYDGLDAVLNLAVLEFEISLRDIYNKVRFDQPETSDL